MAEAAHIIQKALNEFRSAQRMGVEKLPTLSALRAKYPKLDKDTELTWDSWVQPRS